MHGWLVFFSVATIPSALAVDANGDGCDDAYAGNGACVAESASVDATTTVGAGSEIGPGAVVGPELAIGSGVTIAARASLAGRQSHSSTPLPVADGVIIGRRSIVGVDASLGQGTILGRSVQAGERLTTGASVQVGYGSVLGDDVLLDDSATVGTLTQLGDYASVGPFGVVARGVTVADAPNLSSGAVIDGVVGPDVTIAHGVVVESTARVRKQATLEEGAQILGSARVGRDATVGAGATVRGRVGTGADIGAGATVSDGARVERGATVCPGAFLPTNAVASDVFPTSGCIDNTSCLTIYQDDPSSIDGVYSIDPDGEGGTAPFDAYCDMTDGGWTLALRSASSGVTFDFLSPHWTTDSTLSATDLGPTTNADAKYDAFNTVPGTEIRGCLFDFNVVDYACKSYSLPSEQTLLEMFTNTPIGSRNTGKGYFFTESTSERLEWVTMWGLSTSIFTASPLLYVDTGINIDDDLSNYRARVRFGLAVNGQANINTLDDTCGFGASAYDNDTVPGLVESSVRTSSGCVVGSNTNSSTYGARGQIWVR